MADVSEVPIVEVHLGNYRELWPGLLQAVRMENELRVTIVPHGGAAEKILQALSPREMEPVPLTLEDAFISYLGERGEKTFILSELEAQA